MLCITLHNVKKDYSRFQLHAMGIIGMARSARTTINYNYKLSSSTYCWYWSYYSAMQFYWGDISLWLDRPQTYHWIDKKGSGGVLEVHRGTNSTQRICGGSMMSNKNWHSMNRFDDAANLLSNERFVAFCSVSRHWTSRTSRLPIKTNALIEGNFMNTFTQKSSF